MDPYLNQIIERMQELNDISTIQQELVTRYSDLVVRVKELSKEGLINAQYSNQEGNAKESLYYLFRESDAISSETFVGLQGTLEAFRNVLLRIDEELKKYKKEMTS